jgi:hypothetical protein
MDGVGNPSLQIAGRVVERMPCWLIDPGVEYSSIPVCDKASLD